MGWSEEVMSMCKVDKVKWVLVILFEYDGVCFLYFDLIWV